MRVIVDVRVLQLGWFAGGFLTYLWGLLRQYALANHSVSLLAWEGASISLPPELEQRFPVVTVPRWPRLAGVGNVGWFNDAYFLTDVYRRLAKQADLIHFTGPFTYEIGWPQADIGIPRVLTVYDMGLVRWPALVLGSLSSWRYELALAMYHFLANRLQYVDGIISISTYTTGSIWEYVRRVPEIATVLLGVEEQYRPFSPAEAAAFRRRLDLPDKYVLYVGNLGKHKNVAALLQALDGYCPWPVVLAGPQKPELVERLSRQYTSLDTRWLGRVDSADLPGLFASCGVFVYPSLAEGFGLPVLEAAASGVPAVCSNTTSLPEVAGAGAVLFSPYDISDIRQKVLQVIGDESLQRQLVSAGLARASELSWRSSADKTWSAYEQFLHSYGKRL